jgi:predicted dehydrogenase
MTQRSTDRPFGWAILGTGVVAYKFARGLAAATPEMRVAVSASRRPEAARTFAGCFVGAVAAPDYATAVSHDGVDAVYVATPPTQHEAHALLAIAAGRPVLIEKPFAIDAAAARRIADAATGQGVFCMEAMWTRFLPIYAQIRAVMALQPIGELRALQARFMISDRVDPAAGLFDPARGGGALLHRGIYGVSLGDTGVDEDCTVILRHAGGGLSTIIASLRANGRNDLTLGGTGGVLQVEAPIFRPHRALLSRSAPRRQPMPGGRADRLRESALLQRLNQILPPGLRPGGGRRQVLRAAHSGNGYVHEAEAVRRAVRDGQWESSLMPLAESLEIMDILDQAARQIRGI